MNNNQLEKWITSIHTVRHIIIHIIIARNIAVAGVRCYYENKGK